MQSYLFSRSPFPRTSSPALIFKNVVNYAGFPFQQPSYWMTHFYCFKRQEICFLVPSSFTDVLHGKSIHIVVMRLTVEQRSISSIFLSICQFVVRPTAAPSQKLTIKYGIILNATMFMAPSGTFEFGTTNSKIIYSVYDSVMPYWNQQASYNIYSTPQVCRCRFLTSRVRHFH
jgi:hypothetical protein